MEIVGLGGQTAPTTRFGNRNCTNYYILKTNYPIISVTDSGVVVINDKISLSGGPIYQVSSLISPISPIDVSLLPSSFDLKTDFLIFVYKLLPCQLNQLVLRSELHRLSIGRPRTAPSTTRNLRFHW